MSKPMITADGRNAVTREAKFKLDSEWDSLQEIP